MIILDFERIHHLIFGSQIKLLKELNVSIPDGIHESDIIRIAENAMMQFQDSFKSWTSENYLKYLYTNNLIINDENSFVHITVKGVEFLSWMTRNGIREDNPL